MKFSHIITASAAVALLGGAASAQSQPAAPTPGSVTGDWNGAHAPSDEKQYQEKVTVPVGAAPAAAMPMPEASASTGATASTDVTTPLASSATTVGENASVTVTTVTSGPVADTPENRAKYGQPMSRAGKRTAAKGN